MINIAEPTKYFTKDRAICYKIGENKLEGIKIS